MDYYTIEGHIKEEETIKKSRFIVNCFHIESEAQVEEILKNIQKEHYKATHNCYAYVIGENKDIQKFNDDGEPSGTAGKPILEAILHKELTNILVIVTRYFGGTKLGAGGLIRSYSGVATLGIDKSILIKMQFSALLEITCEYTYFGKIKDYLEKNDLREEEVTYEANVTVMVYVPFDEKEKLHKNLVELTNDQVKVQIIREEYIKKVLN